MRKLIVTEYVISTTLTRPEWNNSHVIKNNVPEAVARLKQEPGQAILVAGSSQLVHTLREHDLIDEYRLMVHPIVVGAASVCFATGLVQPS